MLIIFLGSIFLLSAYYSRFDLQWRMNVLIVGNSIACAFGGVSVLIIWVFITILILISSLPMQLVASVDSKAIWVGAGMMNASNVANRI